MVDQVLGTKHVFCYEPGVGRALCQAAHEVGVPLGAEWDVNAYAPTFLGQAFLEVATDSVEHLEFEGAFGNSFLEGPGFDLFDDALIVGSETVEYSALDDEFCDLDVVGVNVFFVLEGDGGWLTVGSLTETNADAFGAEGFGIVFSSEEVGLEYGSDLAFYFWTAVQLAGEVQCSLRVG